MNLGHAHKTRFWCLLGVLSKFSDERPRHFFFIGEGLRVNCLHVFRVVIPEITKLFDYNVLFAQRKRTPFLV